MTDPGVETAVETTVTCPSCAELAASADLFCESCGTRLRPCVWLSSAAPPDGCPVCGSSGSDTDGYCDECGHRRGTGRDRARLVLDGVAAGTDRGRVRRRNEDAVAIGVPADGIAAAVVCDGISTSLRADTAAAVAAGAGIEVLTRVLAADGSPAEATRTAFRAARDAVATLCTADTRHNPPACTYVSGVVTAGSVTVGWAGDSRAYWVPVGGDAIQLTEDDAEPGGVPHAVPLTRWLGADAGPIEARLATLDDPGPGRLIVCSDGLSRYLTAGSPELTGAAGGADEPPDDAARRLTAFALDAGGVDNVAVAVLLLHPPTRQE